MSSRPNERNGADASLVRFGALATDAAGRKRQAAGGLVLALALVSIPAASTMGAALRQQDPSSDLNTLLFRMSRVASLFTDEALRFTCEEKILSRRFRIDGLEVGRREFELNYIYVFDEPSAGGGEDFRTSLLDYRTERSSPGDEEVAREVKLEDLELPIYLLRAYSWVFLFQEHLLSSHDYEIKGYERVMGRDAVVVAFEALPPFRRGLNDWFGTMWIDSETYQLLRVEAILSDQVAERALAQAALESKEISRPRYLYMTFITEFAEEKHGMRFPSQVSIVGTTVEWRSNTRSWVAGNYREYKILQVDQIYSDYSFFSVRTESEIRAFVLAGVQIKD